MTKLALTLLAAVVATPAYATDLHFSEATKACRSAATEHPFRVKIVITPKGNSYSFIERTPFTECLAKEASATDETGNARRLSLAANLDRAVAECGDKFGRAKSFEVSFTPTSTHFAVRTGQEYVKTHACIATLTSMIQGFGASK